MDPEELPKDYWSQENKDPVLGEIHGDITSVSAETRLFLSEWSEKEGYLHGSDVMLACGNLIDKLLNTGERITSIDALRWNAPMYHNLNLAAALKPPASADSAIMHAELLTSGGRKIYITGTDTDRPITRVCKQNYLAKSIINGGGHLSVNLCSMQSEYLKALKTGGSGLLLSTFLDVINIALTAHHQMGWLVPDQGHSLIAGFEALKIPDLTSFEKALFLKLNTDFNNIRITKKGYALYRIKIDVFQGNDEGGELVSTGICNYAVCKAKSEPTLE